MRSKKLILLTLLMMCYSIFAEDGVSDTLQRVAVKYGAKIRKVVTSDTIEVSPAVESECELMGNYTKYTISARKVIEGNLAGRKNENSSTNSCTSATSAITCLGETLTVCVAGIFCSGDVDEDVDDKGYYSEVECLAQGNECPSVAECSDPKRALGNKMDYWEERGYKFSDPSTSSK